MNAFLERLATSWPVATWSDVPVVVAVSGGSDSVALLRGLHAIQSPQARLIVGHFNHRLRGAASDGDEQFVVQLAADLKLEVHCGRREVDQRKVDERDGIEAAARAERYAFLETIVKQTGARYLVTAHTADDQAETILHRIVRGTGIAGLAGIPRVRAIDPFTSIIRPLLGFHREELRAWLCEIEQSHREDESNASLEFTRNRIRHELLPHLAEYYNRGVADALLRLGTLAGEAQEVIDTQVEPLLAKVQTTADGVTIPLALLVDRPRYLVRELFVRIWQKQRWPLQAMGFDEWQRLADAAQDGTAGQRFLLPGGITAAVERVELTLRRV